MSTEQNGLPDDESGLRIDMHKGMLTECTAILGTAESSALCTSAVDLLAFPTGP